MQRIKLILIDSIGPLLGVAIVLTIIIGLLGCSSGGSASERAKAAADAAVGDFNPFALMGWIGAICLIASAFLAVNLKLFQAAMSFVVGLAFLFLASFLQKYGSIVLVLGGGAAVWFIASNWGMVREQIRAWLASRKLAMEGKLAEATALRRQAFPVLDWKMKRASKQRKRNAAKSGTIKPLPEVKP